MTKCGIICEYNPFHNGHKYHLEKSKELTGADIICVMSGDFTQRTQPAIFDKYLRAKAALTFGADAVVELPTAFATAPAELFAYGAVKILSQIKGVEFLSFGVESNNTDILEKIAELQADEPPAMRAQIKALSKSGLSYPNCLATATAEYLDSTINVHNNLNIKANSFHQTSQTPNTTYTKEGILDVLSYPNNILAIEYLKAIKKLNLKIKPIYIKRTDSGYNSPNLIPPFAAAGAIRRLIETDMDYSDFAPFNFGKSPLNRAIFEALARDALLKKDIAYEEGLGIMLKKAAQNYVSLSEITTAVKTKRYTYSRINRLIFSTMSDITKDIFSYSGDMFFAVLGIKKSFKSSLKDLGEFSIIRRSDKISGSSTAEAIAEIDHRASDLYSLITAQSTTRFWSKLLVL